VRFQDPGLARIKGLCGWRFRCEDGTLSPPLLFASLLDRRNQALAVEPVVADFAAKAWVVEVSWKHVFEGVHFGHLWQPGASPTADESYVDLFAVFLGSTSVGRVPEEDRPGSVVSA